MGNKNSSQQTNNNNLENDKKYFQELKKGITKYLKSDKSTNEYLTNINNIQKFNKIKKLEKSNLKENLESNNIFDFCLELTSCLINKSLNHEINTTFYKSFLINKFSENNSDLNILNEQNNMMINWIYKTLLSEKTGKYDNWVPDLKENNWLDKLNHVSSIHANSEVNISSYQLSDKDISLEGKNKKMKNKNAKIESNAKGYENLLILNNIEEKITYRKDAKKSSRTLSAGIIDKDNLQNKVKNTINKKQRFYSPNNKVK